MQIVCDLGLLFLGFIVYVHSDLGTALRILLVHCSLEPPIQGSANGIAGGKDLTSIQTCKAGLAINKLYSSA